ncbi:MAG: chemotaxis protein CheX [Spirochaetaceae bacterium]|jgi:chemotaxis protein CheX|nr:chemotaxis protein CheX [Spirochaetaceae bacterium]
MEKYIQSFIDVCKNIFKELINAEIEAGRPYFSNQMSYPNWDISGVIGITGDASGAIVISLKKALALKLTEILTGKTHDSVDDEVLDSIGEIINIISGNLKLDFEQEFRLVISLPTVVRGNDHTIQWPHSNARIICIPFSIFDGDVFFLAVAIESVNRGTNA